MKIYYRVGNLLVPHSTTPAKEIKEEKEHDRFTEAARRGVKKAIEDFNRAILYIGEEKKS